MAAPAPVRSGGAPPKRGTGPTEDRAMIAEAVPIVEEFSTKKGRWAKSVGRHFTIKD